MSTIKAESVNPFVESVYELFATMMGCEARMAEIKQTDSKIAGGLEIVALIGISGCLRGNVAVIFPLHTAFKVVSRFTGMTVDRLDESLADAIAELSNIIAGSAKAKLFKSTNEPMSLGLPSVITAMSSAVLSLSCSSWIELGFDSELGPFRLRVSMGN